MSYINNLEKIQYLGRFKKKTQSHFLAENGELQVVPYSDNIIRIDHFFSTLNKEPFFSYAVIQEPTQETPFSLKEYEHHFVVEGEKFLVKIKKQNLALSFQNKKMEVLLENEPSLLTAILGTETSAFFKVHSDEKFIGLGEKTGDFNRRGKFYTHKNSDTFAFGVNQDPTYSSIPFFIGIHNGLVYGVFVDHTYTTNFDFATSQNRYFSFSSENGNLSYFFIYGETIEEVIKHYTWLTGRTPLPPLWAIGFHQSRYSYYPEYKLDEVVKGFENRQIPLDAIHFDIHYMDKFKAFTFDKKRFPNPKKTINQLQKKGIKIIPILDPGIKIEKTYFPYEDGIKKNAFVKYVDGELLKGSVWPGVCHYPDFTDPKVRYWWASLCKYYTDLGIEAFWNDMNEPALWGQIFPTHSIFNFEGKPSTFKKARNVYGLLMTRASFEGLQKAQKNKRHFLLTRAAYAGIQRYSAKWTGDNFASDEHLTLASRQILSLGISGVPFAGSDVGGFVANCDGMLYARWIALGAFTPFFRAHKMINSNSSEPWHFGEEVEQIAINYIRLRYRLMPYLYTQFYIAHQEGIPINKPMCFIENHEDWAYNWAFQNQFLFGDSFLVCPIDSKVADISIYLPKGNWYDFYTDKIVKGGQEIRISTNKESIPVFVKSGKIVCMQKPINHLSNGFDKTIEIHIYLNHPSTSKELHTGLFYEDDGQSLDYQNQQFNFYELTFDTSTQHLTINDVQKSFKTKVKEWKIIVHGLETSHHIKVTMGNKTKSVSLAEDYYTILDPIPNFDPFVDMEQGGKKVKVMKSTVKN